MKIYNMIVFDNAGNVIEENSSQYIGKIALCKGGQLRAQREAEKAAERAYQLQKEQLELQRKQMTEMERLEREKELKKSSMYSQLMKKNRLGRGSTLLTDWESLGSPNINRKSLYA